MKTQSYIGKEFVYRGSKIRIARYENKQDSQKFWCEALDNKNTYAKKGEQFPLSKTTIYKFLGKGETDGRFKTANT